MNVHFKSPSGDYTAMFDCLVASGTISTRGLKADAEKFGELVFDVNSAYFYNHGGYEFAKGNCHKEKERTSTCPLSSASPFHIRCGWPPPPSPRREEMPAGSGSTTPRVRPCGQFRPDTDF